MSAVSGPSDGRRQLEALRDATRGLRRALCEGDDAGVEDALALRDEALAALARLGGRGGLDPELAPLLQEVRRLDAEALAEARQRIADVRAELEEIGRARQVVRSLGAAESSARFVSERV